MANDDGVTAPSRSNIITRPHIMPGKPHPTGGNIPSHLAAGFSADGKSFSGGPTTQMPSHLAAGFSADGKSFSGGPTATAKPGIGGGLGDPIQPITGFAGLPAAAPIDPLTGLPFGQGTHVDPKTGMPEEPKDPHRPHPITGLPMSFSGSGFDSRTASGLADPISGGKLSEPPHLTGLPQGPALAPFGIPGQAGGRGPGEKKGDKFTDPHGNVHDLSPTPQQDRSTQNIMGGGAGAAMRQENPRTHRECCEIQGFERFLSELKNELISIFNQESGDKKQEADGVPEIGPLSIDQDSIQKMTQAIKEALAEQFKELIKQMTEAGTGEGGPETATLSGRLDHSHKMSVDVSGNVQVAEIQNIDDRIKTILRQQLASMQIASNSQLAQGIDPTQTGHVRGGATR
jgi:hypothetical protein